MSNGCEQNRNSFNSFCSYTKESITLLGGANNAAKPYATSSLELADRYRPHNLWALKLPTGIWTIFYLI